MKKLIAASSLILAAAMPAAFAQGPASALPPVASAAPDAATLAAANEMLTSMNYRAIAQGMFAQMRRVMPGMMKQGATTAINNSPKLDAARKKAALDKVDQEMPKAAMALDGVFSDPAVLDELVQETAKLYARHFTINELHQIAVFYKTPVGAKMLATMPQLTGESMQIGQRVVMPRIAAIMKKMQPKELAQ